MRNLFQLATVLTLSATMAACAVDSEDADPIEPAGTSQQALFSDTQDQRFDRDDRRVTDEAFERRVRLDRELDREVDVEIRLGDDALRDLERDLERDGQRDVRVRFDVRDFDFYRRDAERDELTRIDPERARDHLRDRDSDTVCGRRRLIAYGRVDVNGRMVDAVMGLRDVRDGDDRVSDVADSDCPLAHD